MRLRKLEMKDAPLMLEWMHDINVVEYLTKDFSKLTLDDCVNFIQQAQDSENDLHLAIVDDNDEYMGTVSLKNIDHEKKNAEFAIAIRSCAMGKGFGKFAMQEIIKRGFEKLNLQEVYWNVKKDNERAISMYDNFRFTKNLKIPEKIGGGVTKPALVHGKGIVFPRLISCAIKGWWHKMKRDLVIEGKFVRLEELQPKHFQYVIDWRNNPENNKFLNQPFKLTMENQTKWYEEKYLTDDTQGLFVMVDKSTNTPFGTIGWTYLDRDKKRCVPGRALVGNYDYRGTLAMTEGYLLAQDFFLLQIRN